MANTRLHLHTGSWELRKDGDTQTGPRLWNQDILHCHDSLPNPWSGRQPSFLCHTLCTTGHLYPLLSHTSLDSLLLLCHFVPHNLQSSENPLRLLCACEVSIARYYALQSPPNYSACIPLRVRPLMALQLPPA